VLTPDERVSAGVVALGVPDAGEVLTLQLAAWVREGHENGTLDIPPLHDDLAAVQDQLADPALTVLGVREGGRLLAMGRFRLTAPDVAFVGRLGVVPDLQRHGLGGAVLRLLEATMPAAVSRIELVTGLRSVSNHEFYGRHGYSIVERLPDDGIARLAKAR
jgi:GNAT superfamily N-acetyltransferase